MQSPGGFGSPTGTQAEKKQVGRERGLGPRRAGERGGGRARPGGTDGPAGGPAAPCRGSAPRTSCPAPCRSCWQPSRSTRPSGSATWRSPRWARGEAAGGKAAGPRPPPGELCPLPAQVTIMGIVRHAEKAPTNILYKVDDMTAAPMDVRQWVDTDVSTRFLMNALL